MTQRLNEITWQDDELTRWIGEMKRGRDGMNLWRDEMTILSRIWRHSTEVDQLKLSLVCRKIDYRTIQSFPTSGDKVSWDTSPKTGLFTFY